jgi:protein involved in polysaccharide export with SLBB domain
MQALVAAGGPTKQASGRITIAKAHTGELHVTGIEQALSNAGSDPQARLDPGDLVVVERRAQAGGGNRYAVLGEVPSPGMFEIPDDGEVRVLDAMEKAGLLSTRPGSAPGPGDRPSAEQSHADLERALLTRGQVVVALNLNALLQGDVSQNLLLQPGDVITIPRRSSVTVYALGEVRTPGRQMLDTGSTILDLLNAAGGVTSGARLSEATLLRFAPSRVEGFTASAAEGFAPSGPGGSPRAQSAEQTASGAPTATAVNLSRLLRSADPKENIALQEGDVLFVPARGQPARDVWGLLSLVPYAIR